MSITALKLLKAAQKKGWTFEVDQGDDDGPVQTASAVKAWELVKEVTEEWVVFFDASGKKIGAAHLMTPGYATCSAEESLVNYTCWREGLIKGEFETLCDQMIEEEMG